MMLIDVLVSFVVFTFVASITPGPNNFMMMASGSVFGLKQTLPHISGVVFGFAVLLSAMILGLSLILDQVPALTFIVRIAGASWLAWLGLKLCWSARQTELSDAKASNASAARPLKFWEAALFQWANPKALAMTSSCAAAFNTLSPSVEVRLAVMVSIFSLIGIATSFAWTLVGSSMTRWLETGRKAMAAQFIMGLLFLGTAAGLMFL